MVRVVVIMIMSDIKAVHLKNTRRTRAFSGYFISRLLLFFLKRYCAAGEFQVGPR